MKTFKKADPSNLVGAGRKERMVAVARGALYPLVNSVFSIAFSGQEHLKGLEDKGFLLLPRHESYFDIPLECLYLHQTLGRNAYYLMKSSLPDWLRHLGGIKILRQPDILAAPKEKRRELLARKEQRPEYVYALVSRLLDVGEIVVIHPEGKGNKGGPFQPHEDLLKTVSGLETLADPLFVAMDIQYLGGGLRPKVSVAAAEPLQTRDPATLLAYLQRSIPRTYRNRDVTGKMLRFFSSAGKNS